MQVCSFANTYTIIGKFHVPSVLSGGSELPEGRSLVLLFLHGAWHAAGAQQLSAV